LAPLNIPAVETALLSLTYADPLVATANIAVFAMIGCELVPMEPLPLVRVKISEPPVVINDPFVVMLPAPAAIRVTPLVAVMVALTAMLPPFVSVSLKMSPVDGAKIVADELSVM
jgi:hypothetical protein